jgi:hypothetical protein
LELERTIYYVEMDGFSPKHLWKLEQGNWVLQSNPEDYWSVKLDLFHQKTNTGIEWASQELSFKVNTVTELGTKPEQEEVDEILVLLDEFMEGDDDDESLRDLDDDDDDDESLRDLDDDDVDESIYDGKPYGVAFVYQK